MTGKRKRYQFILFTCEQDSTSCKIKDGVCIHHKTREGKRKVDCLKNKKDLLLTKGSEKKVIFHCDVCKHDFESMLNNVSKGQWCGMCSNAWKHCGEKSCGFCHERSFTSYNGRTSKGKRKVDCLMNPEVALLPKGSHKKVIFHCDVCKHDFESRLDNIIFGKWCTMCSTAWKYCDEKPCGFCHERSFTSYNGRTSKGKRKVDCIKNKKDLLLPKGSHKKVVFYCDVCKHPFESRLDHITFGIWCRTCVNKTELKVYNFLFHELRLKLKTQYQPDKKYKYMKSCFFDIFLVDFEAIFEIDGPQHTTEVPKEWISSTLINRQIVDKWKEFVARRDNKRVYRFNQHAIWTDSYDWKDEMREIIRYS